MAGTVFKKVDYTLSALVSYIEIGDIGLPDIQRPFVWGNTKVRDLFDSMYKGFPVGYLLFWENGSDEGHRQIGADAKQKVPRLLIVDGQQRLTSLYAVLKGVPVLKHDFRQERLRIAFRPRDRHFEVTDAAVERDPEYIEDISDLWRPETTRNKFEKRFLSRLGTHRTVTEEEEELLVESINRLYNLQNYPFTALELAPQVTEEEVAEVFVRVNSKGTPLNQADFILTLMSVFWDEGRSALEEFCRRARTPSKHEPSPYNRFIEPAPDQLLRVSVAVGFRRARLQHVYSILRGKDLETGEFSVERRREQFSALAESQKITLSLQDWHDYFEVLDQAGYRSGQMVTSQTSLVYCYAMYLIGRSHFGADRYGLRNVMSRWFFMASLTGRYTGASETAMEQDLARLRDVSDTRSYLDLLDKVVGDVLTNDYWHITLPNDLATSSARTPSLYAYYAALNILDARALFSKHKVANFDPSAHAPKSAVERHHLFPRGYLSTIGVTSIREANQAANYALVEWPDNIKISDQAPSDYFAKFSSRFDDIALSQMMYWHALPEGWETMEYTEFLGRRRQMMARVIRDAFERLRGH